MLPYVLKGHTDWVSSLAFSPDGNLLASEGGGKTIILWDVRRGQIAATLQLPTSIAQLAFSPDSKMLASGNSDGTITLWDVKSRKETLTLKGHTGWLLSLAFSPDGKMLASGGLDPAIRLWDVKTGKQKAEFKVQNLGDTVIKLTDEKTGETTQLFKGATGLVERVAFSPDGKTLASACGVKTIIMWDVKTGKIISTCDLDEGHAEWTFSADCRDSGFGQP